MLKRHKLQSTPFAKPINTRKYGWESRSETKTNFPTQPRTPSFSQTEPNLTTPTSCLDGLLVGKVLISPSIQQMKGALQYLEEMELMKKWRSMLVKHGFRTVQNVSKVWGWELGKLRICTFPRKLAGFRAFYGLQRLQDFSCALRNFFFKLARLRGNFSFEFAPKILWCCLWVSDKIVFIVSINTIRVLFFISKILLL